MKTSEKTFDFSELVNDDGSPTEAFWTLWRSDKAGCKENNLFLGKEGGAWVVRPGTPRFVVRHNASTVNNGRCSTLANAQKRIAERIASFAKDRTPEELEKIKTAINVRVEYERPKFGTPEERAARKAQWAAYAEGRREEQSASDYRPSRWELNYTPTEREDVEQ